MAASPPTLGPWDVSPEQAATATPYAIAAKKRRAAESDTAMERCVHERTATNEYNAVRSHYGFTSD
jgi:hypothetical protein